MDLLPSLVLPSPDCVTLPALLEWHARQSPEAPALLAPGHPPLSYAALDTLVARARDTLAAGGIGPGDRVAIVTPPGIESAVAFCAVARAATAAPLNPAAPSAELRHALTRLRARAVVVPAERPSPTQEVARELGLGVLTLASTPGGGFVFDWRTGPALETARAERDGEIALVLQTSGSTGQPRVVPISHRNIRWSTDRLAAWLSLTAHDRGLNPMPLFHIHGLIVLLSALTAGGSCLCPGPFEPARFLTWMEAFQPTWYSAAPAMHHAIVAEAEADGRVRSTSPLRFIRSASAALTPTLGDALERVFQAPVVECYGMTEASSVITANPLPPGARKPRSVGLPIACEVAILRADGTFAPRHEPGEIVVRGPGVMEGYDTGGGVVDRSVFQDGWLRTGDLGSIDQDGYLFITGRLKDVIHRGGSLIPPAEIEHALQAHPAVAQAVAFALPHPTLEEDLAVAIVPRPGVRTSEHELRAFAASVLADEKVPRRIVLLDELPLGPTGKVLRTTVADMCRDSIYGPAEAGETFQAPQGDVEHQLAEVWREVLGVERVGRHDDFFGLGGDSVRAGQVVARLRNVMGVEIELRTLFDARVLAELAGIIAIASSLRE